MCRRVAVNESQEIAKNMFKYFIFHGNAWSGVVTAFGAL
jgi:hypothetical protein